MAQRAGGLRDGGAGCASRLGLREVGRMLRREQVATSGRAGERGSFARPGGRRR
jgi:hypothetical protein